MQNIFSWLFKEFPPLKSVYTDTHTLILQILGILLISTAFIIVGTVFVLVSGKNTDKSPIRKQRIFLSRTIGWALVSCGVARALYVWSIWTNFANLVGVANIITGFIGYIAVLYIPYILRLMKRQATLEDVKHVMHETTQKLDELKEISKTLNSSNHE